MQTLTNGARILDESDRVILEQMIDAVGVARVVDELKEVCHDKAEHLRTQWQDYAASSRWTRKAAKLARLAPQLEMEW